MHCFYFPAAYEVKIFTADKKGAGTSNSVYLVLVGEKKTSRVFTLKNSSRKPKFQRGQTDAFQLAVPTLGPLTHVHIAHCPRKKHRKATESAEEPSSWYLFQVVLMSVVERTKLYFLCRQWVSPSLSPEELNYTELALYRHSSNAS